MIAACTAAAPAQTPRASDLPDWSGAWSRAGGFFEATPEQALEPPPPANSPRRVPAVHAEVPGHLQGEPAARRRRSLPGSDFDLRHAGRLAPDAAAADAYEFVIRPEQTWLLSENGPNTVRIIYTDSRKHPAAEDLWATYTGNNVGRWEKDTRPQITRITNLLAGRRA